MRPHNLPLYVPFNPCKTQVVRMRKLKDGTVYQEADVYIGPRIRNGHWELKKSKWCSPDYWPDDDPQARKNYMEFIMMRPHLSGALLKELSGKRLGCLCPNIRTCHGQILAELVDSEIQSSKPCLPTEYAYFFKGRFSPLSDFYPTPSILPDGPGDCCLAQAMGVLKASDSKQKRLGNEIADVYSNPTQLCRLLKKIKTEWTVDKNVKAKYELLERKWELSPDFRSLCLQLQRVKIPPVEATTSSFWGCGQDIDSLYECKPTSLRELTCCMNVSGVLIMVLTERMSPSPSYRHMLDWFAPVREHKKMAEALALLDQCGLLSGTSITDNLNPPQEEEGEEADENKNDRAAKTREHGN